MLKKYTPQKQVIIVSILIAIVLYILLPQVTAFKSSFHTLRDANMPRVGIAVFFVGISYLFAATVYQQISPKKLRFTHMLLVQVATGFTNRLVPGGLGGLALTGRYLVKQNYSVIQAAGLVTVNNVLGLVAALAILAVSLISSVVTHSIVAGTGISTALFINWVIFSLIITVIGGIFYGKSRRARKMLQRVFRELKVGLTRPKYLGIGLVVSLLLTASFIISFYFIASAFNVHLSLIQAVVVYNIGVVFATITPLPGGIGGAEAGIVGALVAVGVSAQQSLTIALSYRFLTYWLPILPGIVSLRFLIKKKLV